MLWKLKELILLIEEPSFFCQMAIEKMLVVSVRASRRHIGSI
jgi:hypothetical protein